MATEIPDRIGPYVIVKLIGRGGMGLTLEAMRPELEKPCVVKIMLPDLASVPTFRQMFSNEARIGAQLRHNRIVGVFDFGEHEGRLYLVMDRVDGVNLEQFLKALARQKAGPLELGLVVYILGELLEALAYAHGRMLAQTHDISVIHHDITPGNIMISSRGEVLLTDFGIARYVDESGRESRPIGTLLYMAPEQLMGRVTRQSDLYSVGVIFHELLTGSPPLAKVPESTRREALLVEPLPPTGRDDVPPELEALRLALLQRHPEKRLRTAEEGLGMLRLYRGYRASSVELRDQYLRLIGPQSSGWTGYLRSAEARGKTPSLASPWLERLKSEGACVPKHPADRSDDASAPSHAAAQVERQDDEDQTRTRPWEASPLTKDASAANTRAPTVVLRSIPEPAQPGIDDSRTRRFGRVLRRRPKDNGTGPEGRVESPQRHRNAVLQPAAAVAPPPPEAPAPVSRESGAPLAATEVLPPPAGARPASPKTEVAAPPGAQQAKADAPSDGLDRARCIAGVVALWLAATAAVLHDHGGIDRATAMQTSEVLP